MQQNEKESTRFAMANDKPKLHKITLAFIWLQRAKWNEHTLREFKLFFFSPFYWKTHAIQAAYCIAILVLYSRSLLQHQHVTWISIRRKCAFLFHATFSFYAFFSTGEKKNWMEYRSKKNQRNWVKSAATRALPVEKIAWITW